MSDLKVGDRIIVQVDGKPKFALVTAISMGIVDYTWGPGNSSVCFLHQAKLAYLNCVSNTRLQDFNGTPLNNQLEAQIKVNEAKIKQRKDELLKQDGKAIKNRSSRH